MVIGLFIENSGHKDIDLNELQIGNPGIGGSEYQSYILAYYLTLNYKDIECILFTPFEANIKKNNVKNIIVSNVLDSVAKCKENSVDILIINKHSNVGVCDLETLCNLIDSVKVNTVTVGHNYYSKKECNLIATTKYIRRNVFVSRQQYYIYLDQEVSKKSSYIYAFLPGKRLENFLPIKENIVTYTGSITPTKGFHILAKNWKHVLKKCPDAKLNVIGSGKLYSRSTKLGRYNIAEESYEDFFIKDILNSNNEIMESVNFLGLLSRPEIDDVYNKTKVGVVNPSGISECCPVSSIEYQMLGVPVVSKRYGGLIDTIKHNETGLLFSSEQVFVDNLVQLLNDSKMNNFFGENGKIFSKRYFSADVNIPKWYNLLVEVQLGVPVKKQSHFILRIFFKFYYKVKFLRPTLIFEESLMMPFNNYSKFSYFSKQINSLQYKIKNYWDGFMKIISSV